MADSGFDERLARAEKVAAVVALYETPELKLEVYRDLMSPSNSTTPAGTPKSPTRKTSPKSAHASEADSAQEAAKAKTKTTGKKQTLGFDKSINFYSTAGETGLGLKDFMAAHISKTLIAKAVLAVYWLSREPDVEAVTVERVYSAFKTMDWVVPPDLKNTLQQAGTKNYLDTKLSADVKVTTHGENFVEHELVAPKTE